MAKVWTLGWNLGDAREAQETKVASGGTDKMVWNKCKRPTSLAVISMAIKRQVPAESCSSSTAVQPLPPTVAKGGGPVGFCTSRGTCGT